MDGAALQHSWGVVAKSGDEVPLYFYSHLFLAHPEVRELFPVSMSTQRDKLVGALGRIVSNVETLDEVVPFIQQLGRDHRRFSVVAQHYDAVGASLLATLQHFLGPAWTNQLATDWAAAYGLIAKTMVQAAEESAEDSPDWWTADVLAAERRTTDVAVLQVRPQQPYSYRAGQSIAVEIPHRPRLWRYLSPANAPRPDGSIEFHVQLVAGGQVSGALVRSVRVGDQVKLGAPIGGALTRPDGDERDLLLIAGGTGLAPLRAVVEQIDRQWESTGSGPAVHLFHGARTPWNLYEHDLLTRLSTRSWFEYTPAVSDDPSYPGVRGAVGSAAATAGAWFDRAVMICGSPQMTAHAVGELVGAGVARDQISTEQFTTSGDAGAPSKDASRESEDR